MYFSSVRCITACYQLRNDDNNTCHAFVREFYHASHRCVVFFNFSTALQYCCCLCLSQDDSEGDDFNPGEGDLDDDDEEEDDDDLDDGDEDDGIVSQLIDQFICDRHHHVRPVAFLLR